CSVCGATLCREAKSSIVAIATGDPVGELDTLRCCSMSENTATGIGSSTAPTTCSRPLGASAPMIASESSFTLTVLIRRLKLPPSFLIAAESLVVTTWFAPKPFASSNLLSLDVNAVTSHPYAAANLTAMCPNPPSASSRPASSSSFPALLRRNTALPTNSVVDQHLLLVCRGSP